jgi:phosphohistidine swiveling domain-containing protein
MPVPPPPGAVLVAPALLPTMAPILVNAAAIVVEHGGLLGHGAALARELGLPGVVDCPGARELTDGERVLVDGAAGVVIRLSAR